MNKTFTKELFKAALIRALHTALQTMVGMITIGATVKEVDWVHILSVAAVASFVSFCKSLIAGLPEVTGDPDGTMLIDTTDPEVNRYLLQYNCDLEDLATKKSVTFKVNPNADLTPTGKDAE